MDTQVLTLHIPPDQRFSPLVRNVVLDFGLACGFALPVTEMSADSLQECVEEYVRVSQEASVRESYTLELEATPDALSLRIAYPPTVPLNPTLQEDYEIPDGGTDLDALDASGLWLHLVKKKVDRVYFRKEGDSLSLHLIKYQRDAGKSRQYWVMGLSPCLARDVVIDQPPGGGLAGGILQSQRSSQVVRLDPVTMYVLKRLDGKTTFWQIYLDCVAQVGIVTPQKLGAIYEWLEETGLLEKPGIRHSKPSRVMDFCEKIFALDWGTRSADGFMTALHRRVRFLFHPAAVLVAAVAALSGLLPALWHRGDLAGAIPKLDDAIFRHPYLPLVLYGAFLLAVAVHELGHGLTCKHFGGRVDRFGVMLYLVVLIIYCDVSTSWNFPRKRDRILVSLAGPFTTAFLASACFWAFHWTPPGHDLVRLVAATMGLWLAFLFCMNFNPFLRLDGYYILVDAVECPNLRQLAFQLVWSRLKGGRSGDGFDPARMPARLRRLFWFYGIAGILVTVFFIVRPVWHVASALLSDSSGKGRLLFMGILILLALSRLAVRAVRIAHEKRNQSWKLS